MQKGSSKELPICWRLFSDAPEKPGKARIARLRSSLPSTLSQNQARYERFCLKTSEMDVPLYLPKGIQGSSGLVVILSSSGRVRFFGRNLWRNRRQRPRVCPPGVVVAVRTLQYVEQSCRSGTSPAVRIADDNKPANSLVSGDQNETWH